MGGNPKFLVMGIKYLGNEIKAKEKREKHQQMKSFTKCCFQYNHKLPHNDLYVYPCVCAFTYGHTHTQIKAKQFELK